MALCKVSVFNPCSHGNCKWNSKCCGPNKQSNQRPLRGHTCIRFTLTRVNQVYGVVSHATAARMTAFKVEQNSDTIFSGYQAPAARLDPKPTRHAKGSSILGMDVLEHRYMDTSTPRLTMVLSDPAQVRCHSADSSALLQRARCCD